MLADSTLIHPARREGGDDITASSVVIICENVRGPSSCACVPARYVLEPLRRALQDHDDGRLDDDGGRPHGDERLPDDDAHWPDASGTLPWRIPPNQSLKADAGCSLDFESIVLTKM